MTVLQEEFPLHYPFPMVVIQDNLHVSKVVTFVSYPECDYKRYITNDTVAVFKIKLK